MCISDSREAVLLYYYEAMTTAEIAQALGVAKSTVSALSLIHI